MSITRDESGFKHLMRVRLGASGAKGRLLHCKRDTPQAFWKVKLDTGEWAWPEDLIQDGPGEIVSRCAECGMRFMCERADVLCPSCDGKVFGTQQRASEPPDRTPAQRRWDRRHL